MKIRITGYIFIIIKMPGGIEGVAVNNKDQTKQKKKGKRVSLNRMDIIIV
ncbi:MAG: hypothetical protein JRJ38_03510 [Deltaproteobacteria bacterium]|nr:hypothetical protein [Deltaproteobacteria bacterium]